MTLWRKVWCNSNKNGKSWLFLVNSFDHLNKPTWSPKGGKNHTRVNWVVLTEQQQRWLHIVAPSFIPCVCPPSSVVTSGIAHFNTASQPARGEGGKEGHTKPLIGVAGTTQKLSHLHAPTHTYKRILIYPTEAVWGKKKSEIACKHNFWAASKDQGCHVHVMHIEPAWSICIFCELLWEDDLTYIKQVMSLCHFVPGNSSCRSCFYWELV